MIKQVTLLVCLSPSVPHETIDELSFFDIVSPIVQVLNVRLIAREGQMKAFVQVPDQVSADLVIEKLHCQLLNLGKTKVFISNKSAINYTRNLDEILLMRTGEKSSSNKTLERSRGMDFQCHSNESQDRPDKYQVRNKQNDHISQERTKEAADSAYKKPFIGKDLNQVFINKDRGTDCQNTKSSSEEKSIAVMKNMYKISTDSLQCSVKITHSNLLELDSKKVSKIFRRYGRISNLFFNYDETYWTIIYSSPKDVQKVYKASTKNKLFGYELYGDDRYEANQQTEIIRADHDEESCDTREIIHCLSGTDKQYSHDESVKLRIDVIDGYVNIEEICKMIAKVCIPIEIIQGFNLQTTGYFFVAKFNKYEEAAEVLFVLNSIPSKSSSINTRFE